MHGVAAIPYPELLAYAQSLSAFTSAPPDMPDLAPGQPPPPLFFPPFPNEEKMRRGHMNDEAPLGLLGETHSVGKGISAHAVHVQVSHSVIFYSADCTTPVGGASGSPHGPESISARPPHSRAAILRPRSGPQSRFVGRKHRTGSIVLVMDFAARLASVTISLLRAFPSHASLTGGVGVKGSDQT